MIITSKVVLSTCSTFEPSTRDIQRKFRSQMIAMQEQKPAIQRLLTKLPEPVAKKLHQKLSYQNSSLLKAKSSIERLVQKLPDPIQLPEDDEEKCECSKPKSVYH
jgi:hypothetical protein